MRPTLIALRWFVAVYASKVPSSDDDDKYFVFATSFFFLGGAGIGQGGSSSFI
jgi:hypothetical protein